MVSQRGKIILFVFLCLLTVASNGLIDGYRDVGEQLLLNPEFRAGLQGWQVTPEEYAVQVKVTDDAVLRIRSNSQKTAVQVWQEVPLRRDGRKAREKIRIRAVLKTEDVRGNGKQWSRARLIMVQPHLWQNRYYSYYILAALTGTHDWQTYSKVITIAPDASVCQVRIQMPRCRGEFSIQEIRLSRVEERGLYVGVKWLLLGLWTSFILLLFAPVLQARARSARLLAASVLVLIVVGTAMPGTIKNHLKAELLRGLAACFLTVRRMLWKIGYGGNVLLPEVDITKVAHFCLFGMLTFLLLAVHPDRAGRRRLTDMFMLACATELIQLFIDGRSPLFTDVLIDMAGAASALAVMMLWRKAVKG